MSDFQEPQQQTGAPGTAGMCADHPDLRAAFVCSVCGKAICALCAFTRNDGSRVCTACANAPPPLESSSAKLVGRGYLPPEHIRFLKCIQHPTVPAVQVCRICGAPMCGVCEFSLPADLHLCPKCVVAPPRRVSKSRRNLLIAAYALAIYSTVALALFMTGAVRAILDPVRDQATIGLVFSIGLFFPAVVGGALGISVVDRRLNNPASVWVAAIWNGLILALHFLFIILGHLKD